MFYYLLHLKAMHFQKWETLLSHHDRKVVPVNPAVSKCEDSEVLSERLTEFPPTVLFSVCIAFWMIIKM